MSSGNQPAPTPAPPPQQPQPPAPGSAASLDVLVESLEYSFVDLPDLIDEDGSVIQTGRKAESFNPFVKRS